MMRMTYLIKLLLFVLSLVVILEAISYVTTRLVITNAVTEKARKELQTGGEVFSRIIQKNIEQLALSVKVLTDDFGFKDAVASDDENTIRSALNNHSARIKATLGVYISKNGDIVSTQTTLDESVNSRLKILGEKAASRGLAYDMIIVEDKAYQLVFFAVKAPEVIGYAGMGFEINKELSDELKRLTNLDISFIQYLNNKPVYLTGTLDTLDQDNLLNFLPTTQSQGNVVTSDTHILLQLPVIRNNFELAAVLQIPIENILQPFSQLYWQLLLLALIFSCIAAIAAWLLAKSVTRPVSALAETAQLIAKGFYETPVSAKGKDEIGDLARAFISMQSAIRDREKEINYQAQHDSLTDLPNRLQIFPALEIALNKAKEINQPFILILVDIKNFTQINDELSQEIGDWVLQQTGQILQRFNANSPCFRLGSDEFLLLIHQPASAIYTIAEQIHELFKSALVHADLHLTIDVNLGIVVFPDHADTPEVLLRRANLALQQGRTREQRTCIYQKGWDEIHLRRLLLLREFESALESQQISLYYQPKINFAKPDSLGAEALVRWRHPELGFVSPDEFIGVIESSGQITILTRWVLKTAIAQLKQFHQAGIDLTLSVNLSTLDLLLDDLPDYIDQLLEQHQVDAHKLYLEITESALMREADKCLANLKRLQTIGTILSIDDFGTGYSSLSQLKKLPVSELKIDKSFILNLDTNEDDQLIVRSTIELAHTMGLRVTAEGVETDKVKQMLIDLGCDTAQGYLYSKPVNVDDFTLWANRYLASLANTGIHHA